MEPHEYANLFPMLPDAELQELANDIKAHGFRKQFPIITLDGKILDGRNRWRACEIAGVQPLIEEFSGEDPLAFVVSGNLNRRHLSASQRGVVAAKMANLPEGRPGKTTPPIGGVSQDAAAKMLNVGARTAERASRVVKAGTSELVAAVESGEVNLNQAEQLAKLPAARQIEVLAEGREAVEEKAKEIRDFGGEIAPCPKPDFEYVAPPEKEAKKPRNNYRPALGREISIMAITTLQRIGDDDKELEPAYRAVIDHCNERLALNGK
jgi:hypothetical protein